MISNYDFLSNYVLSAQEARKITNEYIPKETETIIKQIGDEIIKLANDGNSTLFISEVCDAWFPYFNDSAIKFFKDLGYQVEYQYDGTNGNYWTISW